MEVRVAHQAVQWKLKEINVYYSGRGLKYQFKILLEKKELWRNKKSIKIKSPVWSSTFLSATAHLNLAFRKTNIKCKVFSAVSGSFNDILNATANKS